MKRFLHSITGVSVAAVVVLAVLSNPVLLAQSNEPNEAKVSESAKVNVDGNGIILKGCDTVGYFEQGKPIKGDSALTSTYRGATYLFASASNKAEFDKDPAKYAPQYGGFCAYGILKGALDDFEGPGDFIIYKGKLYLCGNQNAVEIFKSNIDSNIAKSDANWRRITEN